MSSPGTRIISAPMMAALGPLEKPQPCRGIGGQRHQTRGEHGAEEGVCLAAVHKAGDKADNQTDQPRPQAVAQRSAEHDAKAHTGQNVAEVVDARAVGAAAVQRLTQPAEGLVGRGLFRADAGDSGR